MSILKRVLICCCLTLSLNLAYAGTCKAPAKNKPAVCDNCCGGMGGVQYCDSSAGRLVCKNGFYSSCYCNRHAVMDMDRLQGCCLWQGGVLNMDSTTGMVMCNDGGLSEICSVQDRPQIVATF